MTGQSFSRRGLLAGFVASVTAVPVVGSANTRQNTLSYGDTVTGVTDDTWTFEAKEGDEISIDVRIDDPLDDVAVVDLYQPNGDRAMSSRWPNLNAEDGNAVISMVTVSRGRDGEYTIEVEAGSDSDRSYFEYELSLYEGVPIDQTIEYGDSVKSELTRENRYYDYGSWFEGYHETYAFEAQEGDEITIEMRPDNEIDNDAQLTLLDPDNDRVDWDWSQDGEAGNAVITQYTVGREQDGQYTIVASGDSHTDLFEYELSLYEGIPIDQTIEYGDSVESELTRENRYYNGSWFEGYHETYAFEAQEGDEITIEMRPDNEIDNDAQLTLLDPDNDRVDWDWSQDGEDGNAVITKYEVGREQDGKYTIIATAYDHDWINPQLFEYELSLHEGIPIDQTIEYGDSVESELTREDRYYNDSTINGYHETYGFEALEGNIVSIEMQPKNALDNDAQLGLYDTDGDRIAWDTIQSGDDGVAAISEEELDDAGTYTIVATGDGDTELFEYTLSVSLDAGMAPGGKHPSGVSEEIWNAVTDQNAPADKLTFQDLVDGVQSYDHDQTINGTDLTLQDMIDLIQWYEG